MGVGAGQQQVNPKHFSFVQKNTSSSRLNSQSRRTFNIVPHHPSQHRNIHHTPCRTTAEIDMSATCENCSIRFSILKRKKKCNDCARFFCFGCLTHKLYSDRRRCSQCHNLTNGNFSRQDLSDMSVSYLRSFLLTKNIPTIMCKEKSDLIDLVMDHFGNAQYQQSLREHGQHINLLAEKMRLTNEMDGSPRSTVHPLASSDMCNVVVIDDTIIIHDSGEEDEDDRTGESRHDVDMRLEDQEPTLNTELTTSHTHQLAVDNDDDVIEISHTHNEMTVDVPPNNQQSPHHNQGDVIVINDSISEPYPRDTSDELTTTTTDVINISSDEFLEQVSPLTETVYLGNTRIVIEEMSSLDHINNLSIKQLKDLLARNFVDYKGCTERWELEDRVRRLWHEKQSNDLKLHETKKLEDQESTSGRPTFEEDKDLCKICMDSTIDCVLLECGHMLTCTKCGRQLHECPICRQYVTRVVHTFRS